MHDAERELARFYTSHKIAHEYTLPKIVDFYLQDRINCIGLNVCVFVLCVDK